jgi:hypothetical protein
MQEFLICENPKCRYLICLREGNKLIRHSDLPISACPECDSKWSGRCPSCAEVLKVSWRNNVPYCSHCKESLQPKTS